MTKRPFDVEVKVRKSKKTAILKREEVKKNISDELKERKEFWDINNPCGFILYAKRDNSGRILFDERTGRPIIESPSVKVTMEYNPDTLTYDRMMVEGNGFIDLIRRQERIADDAYDQTPDIHKEDLKKYTSWYDRVKNVLKSVGDRILNEEVPIAPSDEKKEYGKKYRELERKIFGHLTAKEKGKWKIERDDICNVSSSLQDEAERAWSSGDKKKSHQLWDECRSLYPELKRKLKALDEKYGIEREKHLSEYKIPKPKVRSHKATVTKVVVTTDDSQCECEPGDYGEDRCDYCLEREEERGLKNAISASEPFPYEKVKSEIDKAIKSGKKTYEFTIKK